MSAQTHILCYGDSLTAGYTLELGSSRSNYIQFHPWAPVLSEQLGLACFHVGMSGWTVQQMLQHKDETLPSETDVCGLAQPGLGHLLNAEQKVSHVVLMAGTNDLPSSSTALQISSNLKQLHELCHTAGCKTVAVTIPQSWAEQADKSWAAKRSEVNSQLRDYAESLPERCLFVAMDLEVPYRADSENWEADGLHMSREGYRRFGTILATKIREFVLYE